MAKAADIRWITLLPAAPLATSLLWCAPLLLAGCAPMGEFLYELPAQRAESNRRMASLPEMPDYNSQGGEPLTKYAGTKVSVGSISPPTNFDGNCRAAGPIFKNEFVIPRYVRDALSAELKSAGLDAGGGVVLAGTLHKAAFSSLVNGYWDLGLTLTSSNGNSLRVENRYALKDPSCTDTFYLLQPAVRALLQKAFADPRFGGLLAEARR